MHGPNTARNGPGAIVPELVDGTLDHSGLQAGPSRMDRGDRSVSDDRERCAIGGEDHERQPDPRGHRRVGVGNSCLRGCDRHHDVAVDLVDADPLVGTRHSETLRRQDPVPGDRVRVVTEMVGEVRRLVRALGHAAAAVREHHPRADRPRSRHLIMRHSLRRRVPAPAVARSLASKLAALDAACAGLSPLAVPFASTGGIRGRRSRRHHRRRRRWHRPRSRSRRRRARGRRRVRATPAGSGDARPRSGRIRLRSP